MIVVRIVCFTAKVLVFVFLPVGKCDIHWLPLSARALCICNRISDSNLSFTIVYFHIFHLLSWSPFHLGTLFQLMPKPEDLLTSYLLAWRSTIPFLGDFAWYEVFMKQNTGCTLKYLLRYDLMLLWNITVAALLACEESDSICCNAFLPHMATIYISEAKPQTALSAYSPFLYYKIFSLFVILN